MRTIGFVSQDRAPSYGYRYGGAGHYRISLQAQALREHGWATAEGVCVGNRGGGPLGVMPVDFIGHSLEEMHEATVYPSVIVMQRYMNEMAFAIKNARKAGQVVINDVDDLFDALPPSNRAFRATHPKSNPMSNVNHYRANLAASSLITVSTPYLAERLTRYNRPVIVLRNAIDLSRWCSHDVEGEPRLGWVGALEFRANDIEQISGAVAMSLGRGYAPWFVHCGAVEAMKMHQAIGLDPVNVREYALAPIDEYPSFFRHLDVGVVPLSGHPFNSAKSAIKGMEYAAAGIPFIATPSPEYVWLKREHGMGLLADRHKDWVRQLKLLADPTARAELREHNTIAVKALDMASQWEQWATVYDNATA